MTDCVNVRNSQKHDGIWDWVENSLSAQHKFKGGVFQPIVKTITRDLFTLDADFENEHIMIFQLHNHFKPSSEEKMKIALYFEVAFGFIEVTDNSW